MISLSFKKEAGTTSSAAEVIAHEVRPRLACLKLQEGRLPEEFAIRFEELVLQDVLCSRRPNVCDDSI